MQGSRIVENHIVDLWIVEMSSLRREMVYRSWSESRIVQGG